MGPRKLLREGILMKAKSGRRLRGFLCNDILVLTDEAAKALYRMVRCSVSHSPWGVSLTRAVSAYHTLGSAGQGSSR